MTDSDNKTKYPVFKYLLAVCFFIALGVFFPKVFLNTSKFATVFTSSTSGDWNDHNTWGISGASGFSQPGNIIFSPTGEMYISDIANARVVVVNADGTASTSYNGSASTTLGAFFPYGMFLSSTGEIYLADAESARIVVLNPDGTASTTYDNTDAGYSPTGLNHPDGLALSPTGEIYIADIVNNRIVVLNPDGTASTTYDNTDAGYSPVGLSFPAGVALSSTGYIYVADGGNNRIVVLNPDGTASTTYNTLGLSNPQGITISQTGEIYVSDTGNNRIVVLNPDGTASTTYDNTDAGYSPVGFSNPYNVRFSPTGEIYVADLANNRIVILNPDGTASTSFNGTTISPSTPAGIFYPGQDNDVFINSGTVTLTRDESVHNLILANGGTLDLNGHTLNVYGDWSNTGGTLVNNGGTVDLKGTSSQYIIGANTFENLTKISSIQNSLFFDSNNTTTITGNLILQGALGSLLSVEPSLSAPVFDSKIDGPFLNPGLGFPVEGVTVSPIGDIYIADPGNSRIVVLNPDGTASTTIDGSASTTLGSVSPMYIQISSTGKIYTTDASGRVIVFNPDGSVFAQYDNLDANYSPVGFNSPNGFAISANTGELYIADTFNNRVVVLNADGTASTSYDNLDATYPNPGFNLPSGIAISSTGEIYVGDTQNSRIVVLNPDGTASTTIGNSVIAVDMTIAPSGEIYLVSQGSEFTILNPDGTASTTIDGSASTTLGEFNPLGIDLSSDGKIYVSDYIRNRIVVFNPDDTVLATYNNTIKRGAFSGPQGLVRDSQDNIYVTDSTNDVIQEFDVNGNFVRTLDTTGIPSPLANIQFLAVDGSDNIYTVNQNNKTLVKFVNGVYSTSTILAEFPYGFAVSPNGHIYYNDGSTIVYELDSNFNAVNSVTSADGINFNLYGPMTLDATGNFLYIASDDNISRFVKLNASDLSFVSSVSAGTLGVSLSPIAGMGVDLQNNIYVSNFSDNNITIYSPDFGAQLAQFGTSGTGNGQFNFGTYQAPVLDSRNNLYVPDQGNNRIQKFSPGTTGFNILSSGTASTSYLSVSSSTNQSGFAFSCLTGCSDEGGNTNWIFSNPTTQIHRARRTTSDQPLISAPIPTFATTTLEVNVKLPGSTSTTEIIPTLVSNPLKNFIFTQTLRVGSIGEEVRKLQIFLNSNGYVLSQQGPGSRGQETKYFGPKTYKALIKFQEDYRKAILVPQGLPRATGIFWDYTRKLINFILGR